MAMNIKDLSTELDTTPRVARKFLRTITPQEDQPGKGGRWEIEKRQLRSLKKQFASFTEEHTRATADTPADAIDSADTEELVDH